MKATGIVRRIDDLGRVVIPKEIRRTMRIREGDPLEIYTDREGEVIFKKYSPVGEWNLFASQYAETLYKTCKIAVSICDRDAVIACGGLNKKDFLEKSLSARTEELMENRALYVYQSKGEKISLTEEIGNWHISCLMPILTGGDVIGCVASLSEHEIVADATEQKLIHTAADFLSRQVGD
jgi:AbrB family transcriptional regulator (stage V sporulation protein T)